MGAKIFRGLALLAVLAVGFLPILHALQINSFVGIASAASPNYFEAATGTLTMTPVPTNQNSFKVVNVPLDKINLSHLPTTTILGDTSTLAQIVSSTFLNTIKPSDLDSLLGSLFDNTGDLVGTLALVGALVLGMIGLIQSPENAATLTETAGTLTPPPTPPLPVPKYPPNLYRWEGYQGDKLIKQYTMLVNGVWHPVVDPSSIENLYGNILDQLPSAAGLMERFSTSGGAQTFLKSWQMQSEVLDSGSLPITPEAFMRGEKGTGHPLGWNWRPVEMIDPKTKIIYSVDTNVVTDFETAFGWRRTDSGLFSDVELSQAFRSYEGYDTVDAFNRGVAYTNDPDKLGPVAVGTGAPTYFQEYFASQRAKGISAKKILADNPFMFKPAPVAVAPSKNPATKESSITKKIISAVKGLKIVTTKKELTNVSNAAAANLPELKQLEPSFWEKLKNNTAVVLASGLAIVGATLVTFAANETLGAVDATNKLPATWETATGKTAANTASLYLSKLEINVGADLFKKAAVTAPLALAGVPETAGGSLMIDWTALAGASVLGSHGAGVVAYLAENTPAGTAGSNGAQNTPIGIPPEKYQHVIDEHTIKNISDVVVKSKFLDGTNIPELIKLAEKAPPTRQGNGNYLRILDAGKVIGTDMATGKATSLYSVVTDIKNNLVTAHPGMPLKYYK